MILDAPAAAGGAIAGLGLLLRLLHLALTARLPLEDDAKFFEEHARQFLTAWHAAGTPDFWPLLRTAVDDSSLQGVLYPFTQSLVYLAAGGVNHAALAAVQVAAGTATVWLTFATARRAFGVRAAVVAGTIAAIYPPLIGSSTLLLAEALLTALQALFLYGLVRGLEPGRWPSRLVAGVAAGLYMLRPAFQYAGPLLLLALLAAGALQARGGVAPRVRRGGALAGPFLAGVLLVAVPWVLMNGLVYGSYAWSRTGDAWQQIYWGMYPPNRGWWPPDSPVPPKYGVESLPGARSSGRVIEERDLDYLEATIQQVRATPLKAALTEVNKLYQAYLHPSDTYHERPFLVWPLAVPLHRLMLVLLLLGLCLAWRAAAPAVVLAAGLFASALPYLASHIDVRYTVPPSQVATLFAGLAVAQLAGGVGAARGAAPARLAGVAIAVAAPFVVWAVGVPQLLALAPGLPAWPVHLAQTAAMLLALVAAGLAAGLLVALAAGAAGERRLVAVSGAGAGVVLAALYGAQALYDGDWHQWSARLAPGDAVRQTLALPPGWQAPAGGRAELRLYLAGDRAADYEPVVRVNGREVARLGPGLTETGPLRFWAQIMVAARNQGLARAEVPQWIAVPLEPDDLRSGAVAVELAVQPASGSAADGGRSAAGVRLWGDYPPRPAGHVYEGPAVYSRIQGQDEAFLKFVATGEYGIWRWTPLRGGRAAAARATASGGGADWRSDDLSDSPGRQRGEYRIRLLVYGPAGDLAAIF